MKVASVIVTSLMGYALAAPASVDSNTPTTTVASNAPTTTNTLPASKRPETICLRASSKLFLACVKEPKRDEPSDVLRERCTKERDEAKAECLERDGKTEVLEDEKKNKAECAVSVNRTFAQCKKDKVLKSIKADCENNRKNELAECYKSKGLKPDQETTPGTEEVTPGTEEATPGTDEVTPGTDEVTPGTDEVPQSCPSKPEPESESQIDSTGQTIDE
ncbi:hypothetical protein ARSEF1564_001300 [Beauveria bassiana]